MADKVMTYDPEKVQVVWNGTTITGYADGSTIKAERNSDAVTPKTGLQGETVYCENADKSGTVTITLFNSSASLSKLRKAAQNRTKASLVLRNANSDGGFIMSHNKCRILNVPGFEGSDEGGSSEIKFHVPVMNFA